MTDFNPCACLGPVNGEPHCPCAMEQLGLPRNPQPHQKSVAEALADAFKRGGEMANMTALEIAERFELYACDHKPDGWPAIRQDTLNNAAALLRRQHEAILKLRAALVDCKYGLEGARIWGGMEWTYNPLHAFKYLPMRDMAEQALKDTEDLE